MFKKGRGRLEQNRVRQAVEADENKDGRDLGSAGFKRMQTDFASLELPKNVRVHHHGVFRRVPAPPPVQTHTEDGLVTTPRTLSLCRLPLFFSLFALPCRRP